MKFEIYRESPAATGLRLGMLAGGDWRWRLLAPNNEIIASGEGYTSKQNCIHAIELVRSTNYLTPTVER